MKKEYILSDAEKQQKKAKIAENRQKKNKKSGPRNHHPESEEAEPELNGSHEGSISPDEQQPDEVAGPSASKVIRLQNSTFQQLLEEPNPTTFTGEVPVSSKSFFLIFIHFSIFPIFQTFLISTFFLNFHL